MENISYIGLSQQLALQQQMEMTANNVANMSTPGFKMQGPLFSDHMVKPRGGDQINQVVNSGSYRDLAPGTMMQTQNPLDVAISGEGYFGINTAQGAMYTRDGGFSLNANREIVNKAGQTVMDEGGGAIAVPPEVTHITITSTGDVVGDQGVIGRLKLVTFGNEQALQRIGDNLYDASGQAEIPVEGRNVVQGAVEASNVNPVVEMNRMIQLLRMFQSTQKMLQADHDRIRGMIDTLTKV